MEKLGVYITPVLYYGPRRIQWSLVSSLYRNVSDHIVVVSVREQTLLLSLFQKAMDAVTIPSTPIAWQAHGKWYRGETPQKDGRRGFRKLSAMATSRRREKRRLHFMC